MGGTDIYIRRPNKTNYSENNIELNDKLEMFLQEIEMVLGTPPTTVLGRSDYGVGLQSYLHNFNVGESDLIQAINQQITTNCVLSGEFSYTINVEFYKIGQSDSAVIDILVEDDNLVRMVIN
tara:strand:- start:11950 stop:12315 length:366 start_codon:yes stop_codon:yes gene_type:complete